MLILPPEIAEGLPAVFLDIVQDLDTEKPEDWAGQDELIEKIRKTYWSANPQHPKGEFIHAFDNWLAYQRSKALADNSALCLRFEDAHTFNPADEATGLNGHRFRLSETLGAYVRDTHGKHGFTWSIDWLDAYIKGHRRSYLFYAQMFDPAYLLPVREEWLIHVLTQAATEYPVEDEDYRGANLALTMLRDQAKEQSLKNMLGFWIAKLIDSPCDDEGRLLSDLLRHAPAEIIESPKPAETLLAMYAPAASGALHLAKTLDMDMASVLQSFRQGNVAASSVTLPGVMAM